MDDILIHCPVLPPRRNLKSNIARSTGHLWRTSRNFREIWFQRKIREIQILFAYPLPCTCWAHSQCDIFLVEWIAVKMSLHWTKFDPTFLRLELCSVKFLPSQSQELSNAKQNAARGKVVKAVKFKGHDRPQAVQISIWPNFSRIFSRNLKAEFALWALLYFVNVLGFLLYVPFAASSNFSWSRVAVENECTRGALYFPSDDV